MKQHYLTPLFEPASIAVIGASATEGAVGTTVFANLLEGGYPGLLYPVNIKHAEVQGHKAHKSITKIGKPVDLVIITTPQRTLIDMVTESCRHGVKGIVIMSCDFVGTADKSRDLLDKILVICRQYNVRLLGPTVFGQARPVSKLNSGNYAGAIKPGSMALVSQSSSVASAILDWAESQDVGFSSVISLGSAVDMDVGETLDYLVSDPKTRSILLYVEDVSDARTFMSALRAAARTKPVMVLKVGRYDGGEKLGRTHSERLIGSDEVFDNALRRAGVLRLRSINQLFIAARVLPRNYRTRGRRLAVITNGIGAGMMAVDRAGDLHIPLPRLSPATITRLDGFLPAQSSHDNPIDILGNASAARFHSATEAALEDENIDGVLVVFTPQMGTDHMATAEAMITLAKATDKPLLLAWIGGKKVQASRKLLAKHNMAFFSTPEHAVEVFWSLASWQYSQQLLLQTPGPLGEWDAPDMESARMIVDAALGNGRDMLDELESKALLRAFHIPVTTTVRAATAEAAVTAAMGVGLPVVLKLDVVGLTHKTDFDGVVLNLTTLMAVSTEATRMLARARERFGDRVRGLTVQPMISRKNGRELMVGAAHDPAFGPVISFGAGGVGVEVFNDVAVALPPLNDYLVDNLIRRTRVKNMLGEFRNRPPVDVESVKDILLRISEMLCEFPQVQQLDINPLIADENGAIALDARILLAPVSPEARRYGHMAIHPYPSHLVQVTQLKTGMPMTIRPIRPEDAEMIVRFVDGLSEETRYNRYMSTLKALSQTQLVRFTQIDYAREMALVSTVQGDKGEMIVAVARFVVNVDNDSCEFAIVIDDQWQGKGLGGRLMEVLFNAARDMRLSTVEGEVLSSNANMLTFMRRLGFVIHKHPEDDGLKWVVKAL